MINIIIKGEQIFLNIMLFCGFLSTTTEVFGMIELQNSKKKKYSVEFFIKQQNSTIVKKVNSEGVLEDSKLQIPNVTTYQKLTIQETVSNNPFSFSVLENNTLTGKIIQPTKKQFDTVSSYLSRNEPVYVHIINQTFILESQNTNKNILNELIKTELFHKQSSSSFRNDNTTVNNDDDKGYNPTFTDSGFLYGTPESRSNDSSEQAGSDENNFFKKNDIIDGNTSPNTDHQNIQTIINTISAPAKIDHDFVVVTYIQFREKEDFKCTFFSTPFGGDIKQELPDNDIPNINSLSIIYTDQFNNQQKESFEDEIIKNHKIIISFQQKETTTYYHVKIKKDPNTNGNKPSETTNINDDTNLSVKSNDDPIETIINEIDSLPDNWTDISYISSIQIFIQNENPSNRYLSNNSLYLKDNFVFDDKMPVIYTNKFSEKYKLLFNSYIEKGHSIIISYQKNTTEAEILYKVEKDPKDNIQIIIDWLAKKANNNIIGIEEYKKSHNDNYYTCTTDRNKKLSDKDISTITHTIYTDQFDKTNQKNYDDWIIKNGPCLVLAFYSNANKKHRTLYCITKKLVPRKETDSEHQLNGTPTNNNSHYIYGSCAVIMASILIALAAYKFNYLPDALSYSIANIKNYASSIVTNHLSLSLFKE
jgi:hypothetical protein